jgi:hypothetical protein
LIQISIAVDFFGSEAIRSSIEEEMELTVEDQEIPKIQESEASHKVQQFDLKRNDCLYSFLT